jgi:hypothetical protein
MKMRKTSLELLYEKIGINLYLVLFIVSRILDSISTEILHTREGFHEHYENVIFYSIENHWLGYLASALVMFIFIISFIFLYKKSTNIQKYQMLCPMLILPIWTFFIMSWIAVTNNILLIIGITPPPGIQFHTFFTVVLITIITIYGIFLIAEIVISIKKRQN